MSMYGDYVRERIGDEIMESHRGFATYRFIQDGETNAVYIVDIYITPDFRKAKMASELADEICSIARSKGCSRVIGTVSATAKNPTDSIKVLLGYGMEFYKCNSEGIFFKKEI